MNLKADTTKAWFVPAAQRAIKENNKWRSSFAIKTPEQLPFDCGLQTFAEHTLAADTTLTLHVPATGTLVLLPTAGAIRYRKDITPEYVIAAGSLLVITQQAGQPFTLHNSSTTGLANVLAIHIAGNVGNTGVYAIELSRHFGTLVSPIAADPNTTCSFQLGIYAGRVEDQLHHRKDDCLLAYIIEGAFEV
ncbi:hypothetical protein [Cnuella takakiae]|uniref:hypothetical protein n=1 Tax=Cnuella takakiae TaxID=1302690 RepID=UPI000932B715|nr:hypothetical protein [Cnuella takakiae]OLY93831.1 hypothetical protein BUE76_19555 [Cnuella takakiae]